MHKSILFSFFFFAVLYAQAQLPKVPTDQLPTGMSPGRLVSQFASALKPSSFTPEWKTEGTNWLANVKNLVEPSQIVPMITKLAGFIKPGMFKSGSGLSALTKLAQNATTMGGVTSLLKSFEGGLKPEAFVSSWAGQRGGWLKALDMLK